MWDVTLRLPGRTLHIARRPADCDTCHNRAAHTPAEVRSFVSAEIERAALGSPSTLAQLRDLVVGHIASPPSHWATDAEIVKYFVWLVETQRLVVVECIEKRRELPAVVRDRPALLARRRVSHTATTWIAFRVVDDITGQSIVGVKLEITKSGTPFVTKTTNADGEVFLQDLEPDSYGVTCPIENEQRSRVLRFVGMGAAQRLIPKPHTSDDTSAGTATHSPIEQDGHDMRIVLVDEHKVRTGESLKSLADGAGMAWQTLAKFNWDTDSPDAINAHLRDEVGCTAKTRDGYNYSFRDTDKPGIVYIPRKWEQTGFAVEDTHIIRVRRLSRFFVILQTEHGLRVPNVTYEAILADQTTYVGQLGLGGVDAINDPPEGAVVVTFPDLDDIEGKALAAAVRQALGQRNLLEVHRLFRYPAVTVQRVFASYDRYFNDYSGQGLLHDITQEFQADADARMVLHAYLARTQLKALARHENGNG